MKHHILTASIAALVLTTGALAQTSASSTRASSASTGTSANSTSVNITKGSSKSSASMSGGKSMMNMAPVNVNTASVSDLEKIPGMSAKLAQAVVAARPFKNEADLVKKVKGIGKKNVKKFEPYLKFS